MQSTREEFEQHAARGSSVLAAAETQQQTLAQDLEKARAAAAAATAASEKAEQDRSAAVQAAEAAEAERSHGWCGRCGCCAQGFRAASAVV